MYTSLTDHPEQTNPYYTYQVKRLNKKYTRLVVVEINVVNKQQ
ncbi:hypothetical protein EMELA_v1c06480 [Mesoplasma melaleucae]|uniref:Uncharacterized protein n=1 Tax=Mesoplasma melaleucae TaxID=81459 RepID=A0A2K8NWD1_9MOLU|nr:hypothetical protein EMELA_v1c06480 [Mesoplasma melaleucae]